MGIIVWRIVNKNRHLSPLEWQAVLYSVCSENVPGDIWTNEPHLLKHFSNSESVSHSFYLIHFRYNAIYQYYGYVIAVYYDYYIKYGIFTKNLKEKPV